MIRRLQNENFINYAYIVKYNFIDYYQLRNRSSYLHFNHSIRIEIDWLDIWDTIVITYIYDFKKCKNIKETDV